MNTEVKEFVKAYNKHIDWNKEILVGFKKTDCEFLNNEIIDSYLDTKKITKDGYDLERAVVYLYEKENVREMNVFSNEIFHTVYFWCNYDLTEDEYKANQIKIINEKIAKYIAEANNKIAQLRHDLEEIKVFSSIINK